MKIFYMDTFISRKYFARHSQHINMVHNSNFSRTKEHLCTDNNLGFSDQIK